MSTTVAPGQTYTYGDYRDWPEDERWELIDGVPYAMTRLSESIRRLSLR